MEKSNKIEIFKNILIVVLVFTTILLLYFLWGNKSIESFMFNDNQKNYEELSLEKIIIPNEIIIGRGNEDYTISYFENENLWNKEILNTFRNFSNGSNIFIEEITKEKYNEVMRFPAIIAKFKYDIPFMEFCEKNKIKQVVGYDDIDNLTEIGFSEGSKESVFVVDKSKDKYYRIVGNNNIEVFNEIDKALKQKSYVTYYTLRTFLGEKINNEILAPVDLPVAILPVAYKRDMQIEDDDIISNMAQEYFGETFDFVRKVEESNGTTIYMYGYGQKVLIINPNDGSIEYKAEANVKDMEKKSMIQSLEVALDFIGEHGGFHTMDGNTIKPYLESVTPLDDKSDGYKFIFSFRVGKNKLFYEEQMPIILEVVNGQTSYFRRELISINEKETEKRSEDEETISAINILATNYEYIKQSLLKAGILDKEKEKTVSFEDIANEVDNFYTGYLKKSINVKNKEESEAQEELQPVWIVEIKGFLLYFDLYSGEPKGFSKVND